VFSLLRVESDAVTVVNRSIDRMVEIGFCAREEDAYVLTIETLEAMIAEGWITPR